jgi:hypothetical protein
MFARQADQCMHGMLIRRRALGFRKADVTQTVRAVHVHGVFLGHAHEWRRAARKNWRWLAHQIDQRARIARRMSQTHVAGRNRQAKHVAMRVGHEDGERVIHARVGVDQQLQLAHGDLSSRGLVSLGRSSASAKNPPGGNTCRREKRAHAWA